MSDDQLVITVAGADQAAAQVGKVSKAYNGVGAAANQAAAAAGKVNSATTRATSSTKAQAQAAAATAKATTTAAAAATSQAARAHAAAQAAKAVAAGAAQQAAGRGPTPPMPSYPGNPFAVPPPAGGFGPNTGGSRGGRAARAIAGAAFGGQIGGAVGLGARVGLWAGGALLAIAAAKRLAALEDERTERVTTGMQVQHDLAQKILAVEQERYRTALSATEALTVGEREAAKYRGGAAGAGIKQFEDYQKGKKAFDEAARVVDLPDAIKNDRMQSRTVNYQAIKAEVDAAAQKLEQLRVAADREGAFTGSLKRTMRVVSLGTTGKDARTEYAEGAQDFNQRYGPMIQQAIDEDRKRNAAIEAQMTAAKAIQQAANNLSSVTSRQQAAPPSN